VNQQGGDSSHRIKAKSTLIGGEHGTLGWSPILRRKTEQSLRRSKDGKMKRKWWGSEEFPSAKGKIKKRKKTTYGKVAIAYH